MCKKNDKTCRSELLLLGSNTALSKLSQWPDSSTAQAALVTLKPPPYSLFFDNQRVWISDFQAVLDQKAWCRPMELSTMPPRILNLTKCIADSKWPDLCCKGIWPRKRFCEELGKNPSIFRSNQIKKIYIPNRYFERLP